MTAPSHPLPQEKLRSIAWDIGQKFPSTLRSDQIHFAFIHPRQGYLSWNAGEAALAAARNELGQEGHHARMVVRIYDVTDIIFDGSNANHWFDIEVNVASGGHYLRIDRLGRNLLAEFGLRGGSGAFRAIARSAPVRFDRDRPVRDFRPDGLFVAGDFKLVFPVESIFDARVYERLNRDLPEVHEAPAPCVAVVYLGWGEAAAREGAMGGIIHGTTAALTRMGGTLETFAIPDGEKGPEEAEVVTDFVERVNKKSFAELRAAHKDKGFQIVHCHDWYSTGAGLRARKELGLPLVLQLHSTEHERAHGRTEDGVSRAICDIEREAVLAADLVVVPHSATATVLTEVYGATPAKVVIIGDPEPPKAAAQFDGGEVKKRFHLNPAHPMVLFCGEISHAAGADLLVDCLPHLCRGNDSVQFLFAGEGPLRHELEGRANGAGLGHRARFTGDVSRSDFEALIAACDFVAVPAHTWQDEGVAQAAIQAGKSVLATHQAHLSCVQHGTNGLIAYDNPNSIIWGVQELLSNPPQAQVRRAPGARQAGPSMETAAIELLMVYHSVRRAASRAEPAGEPTGVKPAAKADLENPS